MGDADNLPVLVEKRKYSNLEVSKIVCGANHVLLHAGGSVYAWGNRESGQTGINWDAKKKMSAFNPHLINLKGVFDIFSGKDHSFALCQKGDQKRLYAWGFNKNAQLGLGHKDNLWNPEEVEFFKDMNIKCVTGGESHTLFLTEANELYVCGQNLEGQCGIIINNNNNNDDNDNDRNVNNNLAEGQVNAVLNIESIEYKEEIVISTNIENRGMIVENVNENMNENENENGNKNEKEDETNKINQDLEAVNVNKNDENLENVELEIGIIPANNMPKRAYVERDEDADIIFVPIKLDFFDPGHRQIDSICSSENYNYAFNINENQAYSWGVGTSYVLGNKKEDNEKIPFTIPKEFYKNLTVDQV